MTAHHIPISDAACICDGAVRVGWVGAEKVRICQTGDHVIIGWNPKARVYVYVENPGDVIDAVEHCWLCGGIEPNETVTVAREYRNGPRCRAYKTKVHTGCWQDMNA